VESKAYLREYYVEGVLVDGRTAVNFYQTNNKSNTSKQPSQKINQVICKLIYLTKLNHNILRSQVTTGFYLYGLCLPADSERLERTRWKSLLNSQVFCA
jgi:hypothetical protein